MRHLSEMYTIDGGKLRKHIIIHPESDSESDSDDERGKGLYAGGGGSIKTDFKKLGKYFTAKKGGLASMLVNNGIPAVTGALGGAASEALMPEGGPVSGFIGSQLGSMGGKYASKAIDRVAGTGARRRGRPRKSKSTDDLAGGALKQDLVKAYNKVVPKSMQPTVNKLAAQVGNYALDKAGYGTPIKGGKLKQDLIKTYNSIVPKSMQPTVNKLAGQVGNYALDKAGYGTPIPVGKGFKKGSQAAKDHMARIRAMRKK